MEIKAQNRVLAMGLIEGEGPVVTADGRLLAVEMAGNRACVSEVTAGGVRTIIECGGRPNGMTVDGDGRLWIAEAREGVVLCYDRDRRLVKTIRNGSGRFIWPNDLRFGPNGMLYLTDSGILDTVFIKGIAIDPDWRSLRYDGAIYEIDPISGDVLRTLDEGIRFTNGICFDATGNLYANETIGGNVYRYDVSGKGRPKRQLFGNVNIPDFTDGWYGPDGMTFGGDGRLYCTVYGQGDITVLDDRGQVTERIKTNGLRPTNIAFVPDRNEAYVTEVLNSAVEIVPMPCTGLPLHKPNLRL